MDKLWAPWRVKYVTKILSKSRRCVFCRILSEKNDRKNFIFLRTKYSFAVLNIYPYNNGHVLVMPYRHVKDIAILTRNELMDLMDLVNRVTKLTDKIMKPQGYNIGVNIGRAAGAGFPGHVHVHIVPRWLGDVNFMPVLTDTKVISQSLRALWTRLRQAQK